MSTHCPPQWVLPPLGPALHTPPAQASPTVQGFASSQLPAWASFLQPFVASQLSSVHTLLSSQSRLALPVHEPPLQESPIEHWLPSSHPVPSCLATAAHFPVFGAQDVTSQGSSLDVSQVITEPGFSLQVLSVAQ